MSDDLGAWLREQRQARGWNVPEMARQLRQAARACGDVVPNNEALFGYIRRWERGQIAPSERYQLPYCQAFGIPPAQFGPAHRAGPGLVPPQDVAYRGMKEPDAGLSTVEREVLMAAHEGSEHAERAEACDIGEATLEQLRADVVRLSGEFMTGEPLPLFLEMRRVRGRIHAALDRRLWPRDATELYFLAAAINCLMAVAARDLGFSQSGEELVRAGWAYAVAIDHRPLMAHLRMEQAGIAYWHQPRQSRDLAESGLQYLGAGPTAAQLHLQYGRVAGRLGDADAARRAVIAAREAGERDYGDELLQIGGEFGLSRATQRYLVGSALVEIPDAEAEAVGELERAIELYRAGPEPGEQHGFGCVALAHIDLAATQLRAGQMDGAAAALEPALILAPGQRIDALSQHLGRVRAELAHPRYQGSSRARDLDERIEDFDRETIVAELRSLPAGPG